MYIKNVVHYDSFIYISTHFLMCFLNYCRKQFMLFERNWAEFANLYLMRQRKDCCEQQNCPLGEYVDTLAKNNFS